MLSLLMVALPLLFAALAPLLRKREQALFSLLPLAGVCLCLLSGATLLFPERDLYSFYIGPNLVLATDATNSFFLQVTSGLFLAVAIHAFFWLPTAQKHSTYRAQGIRIMHRYLFVMFLLAFVSMMNLSILAAHFGLMWVAIEATTLASAPLIILYCKEGALEAMWK